MSNSDSNVALEDVGAVKVITTKENISKMQEQFKNNIPKRVRPEADTSLDTFLDTIDEKKRGL